MRNVDITKPHVILEKLDGCCEEGTIIITPESDLTIKELCEQDYKGLVLGYDHKERCQVWTGCVGTSIEDNNKEWYAIVLEDGKEITLTGNHKVYCANLEKYVKVEDLTLADDVILFE